MTELKRDAEGFLYLQHRSDDELRSQAREIVDDDFLVTIEDDGPIDRRDDGETALVQARVEVSSADFADGTAPASSMPGSPEVLAPTT